MLTATSSTRAAAAALIVLGGPGAAGMSLLFAQLKQTAQADVSYVLRIRAVFSFAWVGGPPVATVLMGALGNRAVAVAMCVVSILNIAAIIVALLRRRGNRLRAGSPLAEEPGAKPAVSKPAIVCLATAFIAAHAANSSAVTSMALFWRPDCIRTPTA
ncbi:MULTISPECIES: hypothetical protein [Arthrobacter]|uniref:Uncharacterized protein n=1 Tax=Arthrobacter terricola TaxID=2547396 RepID=A0A4R5L2F2_9MICC|nr:MULTISPECIES: hypothetical protein [Arthrobacter]MBT8158923.1 hypothetical protein [Arthrobacter sp. GN70]TDG01605.1 hypothetical protein E1809_00460 [Arthrobacter terricola]